MYVCIYIRPKSLNACICSPYLQCFVSEMALAVFEGISANSREVVLGQCQTQHFRRSFAFEMPNQFLGHAQNMPPNIVSFGMWQFLLLPHVAKITSTWGDESCVFGGVKIARDYDIYFLGAASGFGTFCKCLQIPCFGAYSSPLPMVRASGFWG